MSSYHIDPLKGLNGQQLQAVEATEGAVLVLAGAGSGKTRVLAHRIAHIIQKGDAKPWQILAVTFTNKAANELRERVAAIAPDGNQVAAGTFHSMMLRLLRREHKAAGFPQDFTVFDSDDSKRLVKIILNEMNEDRFRPNYVHSAISRLKNDFIPPDQCAEEAQTPRDTMIANVYKEYQEKIARFAAMDFDDLLSRPIEVFRNHPMVLNFWSNRWRYILVDEFQDTNRVQFELVQTIAGPRGNLFVVGDDDQSIYSWRGARVENIFQFKEKFDGAQIFRLERNYRSTQPILDLAHSVVSNSIQREAKKLWTERTDGKKPTAIGLTTDIDEVREVVDRIAREVMSGKRSYKDFAILYRTNDQSQLFEDALRARRFPYQVIGALKFLDRKEIRDILGYWKLILNPRDDVALRRIVKEPPRGIGDTTIDKLVKWARENDSSLTEALSKAHQVPGLNSRAVNTCRKFGAELEKWREGLKEKDLGVWAQQMIEETGYLERLEKEGSFEAEGRIGNLERLVSSITAHAEENDTGLRGYLEEVTLATDVDRMDDSADSVFLMTLHASKGLEFPIVFVTGLEAGLFPLENQEQQVENMDEERRLFYVGVTRAEDELFLTYAKQRRRWGQTRYTTVSNFLREIPKESVNWEGLHPYSENQVRTMSLDMFQSGGGWDSSTRNTSASNSASIRATGRARVNPDDIPAIHVGDLVEHERYGQGIVATLTRFRETHKVTVQFDHGFQTFVQDKARLQPVKKFK
ncbi:UvrD-helicase domain-containing protein [bacterium]|nr:UvrD-helicase domain-containing protein [bacterium]